MKIETVVTMRNAKASDLANELAARTASLEEKAENCDGTCEWCKFIAGLVAASAVWLVIYFWVLHAR